MADYPIRTREQAFLAAIAGEGEMPTPKNRKEAILAKAGGADVDIEPKNGNEYWTLRAMQGGGSSDWKVVSGNGIGNFKQTIQAGATFEFQPEKQPFEDIPSDFYGSLKARIVAYSLNSGEIAGCEYNKETATVSNVYITNITNADITGYSVGFLLLY